MNDELLVAYLNDHLAGSVVAVEMIEHCRNQSGEGAITDFLSQVLQEIEEDRDTLKDLITRAGGKEHAAKKGAAWLSEKVSRLKTAVSEPSDVAFARMEQFEVLFLGVTGKLALWNVLEPLLGNDPRFADIDWRELKRRAEDQRQRIERRRIEAAREALGTTRESG